MDSQSGRIVVGYDGREPAEAALDWATAEALRLQRPLTVVHILDSSQPIAGPAGSRPWWQLPAELVGRIATEGAARARKNAPTIDVSPVTGLGQVAGTLIEVSREAELIVLGTRGQSQLAAAVTGSTAFAISAHAHCPVVVVRGDSSALPGPDRPVAVGLDGSGRANRAARFAADLASSCAAPLILVTAYPDPNAQIWAEPAAYQLELDACLDLDTIARMNAGQITSTAYRDAQAAHPGLSIRQQLIEGPTAEVLADAAHGCGLLVVGSRGRGALTGLLLGSVSHELVHCAPVPVAIVRSAPVTSAATARLVPRPATS